MLQNTEQILLSWTAPEFIRYKKTSGWFASLGILSAGIFVVALLLKNYFLAILTPLAAFLIYLHAKKYPKQITVKITAGTIIIDETTRLLYKEITSFWISEDTETKKLILETKKIIQAETSLLLGDQDPAKVREILKQFLIEKKHEESFFKIIARKLKF